VEFLWTRLAASEFVVTIEEDLAPGALHAEVRRLVADLGLASPDRRQGGRGSLRRALAWRPIITGKRESLAGVSTAITAHRDDLGDKQEGLTSPSRRISPAIQVAIGPCSRESHRVRWRRSS
jgi:hypothetical protein